jgi:hypothetical protein
VSFGRWSLRRVEAKSEIRFHRIKRASGERIRHQKVSESGAGPVENTGVNRLIGECRDGKQTAACRIASKSTMGVTAPFH